MVSAVLFDLNGILIKSRKLSERFSEDFGVPVSEFLSKLSEIMDKVRRPNAGPAFTYWEPVLEGWRLSLTEPEFWDYWFSAEVPDQEMVEVLRALKAKGLKVIVLSNNFRERAEYYGHYPWLRELVDKVYYSWQTGFVKPDGRAFELALKENSLEPGESAYFDDQDKNVAAARSLGIQAYRFEGPEQVRRLLL